MDKTTEYSSEEFHFFNELGRKAVHFSVWLIPLTYHGIMPGLGFSSNLSLQLILLSLMGVLLIFIPLEIYRLRINPESWIQVYFFKFITRASEKENPANYIITTVVWIVLLLGVGVFYSMEVAELVLVTTVMGDSAAALVGKGLGRNRLILTKNKTIEGFIAGILTNYVIGLTFLIVVNVSSNFSFTPFILPLIPVVVWAFFDFFEDLPWYLADNLFGPVLAAIFITIIDFLVVIF
ncbi:MAG: phosphatidate cytidylyltransferase [Candidatus Hodarchaeales archaeon]|jgi:dolichol kinase